MGLLNFIYQQTSLVAAVLALTVLLAIACGSPREVAAQPISLQQPSPSPIPAATATALPASTPSPGATADAEIYETPTPWPTPLPFPSLALEGGSGSLICTLYPDSKGNPALVAHWTVDVNPGATAMVDYPFVADDELELSVFGQKIGQFYMESPGGERMVEIDDTLRPWNGETTVHSSGRHSFYFDNTGGDSMKTMHLTVTYHTPAPESVILAPHEDEVLIPLPQRGE